MNQEHISKDRGTTKAPLAEFVTKPWQQMHSGRRRARIMAKTPSG